MSPPCLRSVDCNHRYYTIESLGLGCGLPNLYDYYHTVAIIPPAYMMRFHSITIPTHTLFPVIGASCYQPTVTYLINDEAFGYLSRVIVTPAVDPRLIESLQRNDSEHWAEFTFSQHLLWPSEGYVSTRQSGSP
ncbi:hypothetical protein ADUPG1_003890 [Aduncisulcus paluster]|uniref:Uncharacterized protein n=1 Tax=Aduncisulcus paluster TaxID=2918883 RepID=A0ABQ5KZV6_9EUKA|nr:hypothetical protein ADUPG1_003890 [Aduncisulcus paluster]